MTCAWLFDTDQWDEPAPAVYDPPIMLNPGRFFSSPDGQHIECQALGPNG